MLSLIHIFIAIGSLLVAFCCVDLTVTHLALNCYSFFLGVTPVSYTHLDVYKRQRLFCQVVQMKDQCVPFGQQSRAALCAAVLSRVIRAYPDLCLYRKRIPGASPESLLR